MNGKRMCDCGCWKPDSDRPTCCMHDVRWPLSCPSQGEIATQSEIIPALAYHTRHDLHTWTLHQLGNQRKLGTLIFDLTDDSTMMMSAFPEFQFWILIDSFLSFEANETKPLLFVVVWCCWDWDRHGSQLDPAALHMAHCHRCMAPTYLPTFWLCHLAL